MDDFYVESPVTEETSAILDAGLDDHAEVVAPVIGYERMFLLEEDGVIRGRLLGVESFCDVHQLGIKMAVYKEEQAKLLQNRGYQQMGELPNRPTGKTCTFWIRPQYKV